MSASGPSGSYLSVPCSQSTQVSLPTVLSHLPPLVHYSPGCSESDSPFKLCFITYVRPAAPPMDLCVCHKECMAGIHPNWSLHCTKSLRQRILPCEHSMHPDKVPFFLPKCTNHCYAITSSSHRVLVREHESSLNNHKVH